MPRRDSREGPCGDGAAGLAPAGAFSVWTHPWLLSPTPSPSHAAGPRHLPLLRAVAYGDSNRFKVGPLRAQDRTWRTADTVRGRCASAGRGLGCAHIAPGRGTDGRPTSEEVVAQNVPDLQTMHLDETQSRSHLSHTFLQVCFCFCVYFRCDNR